MKIKLSLLSFFMFFLTSNTAYSLPKDDEFDMKIIFMCMDYFNKNSAHIYGQNKQMLTDLHKKLNDELAQKYSNEDHKRLITKALVQATMTEFKESSKPEELCRGHFEILIDSKNSTGFYFKR